MIKRNRKGRVESEVDVNAVRIYTDGGSRGNPGPAGVGVVITKPSGELVCELAEFIGTATSNQAEYKALIAALRLAGSNGITNIAIFSDSQVVVQQVRKVFQVKEGALKELWGQVQSLLEHFSWTITLIPRKENKRADELATRAMDGQINSLLYET